MGTSSWIWGWLWESVRASELHHCFSSFSFSPFFSDDQPLGLHIFKSHTYQITLWSTAIIAKMAWHRPGWVKSLGMPALEEMNDTPINTTMLTALGTDRVQQFCRLVTLNSSLEGGTASWRWWFYGELRGLLPPPPKKSLLNSLRLSSRVNSSWALSEMYTLAVQTN